MPKNFEVLGKTDDELEAAASAAGLALRVDELRKIAENLGRNPTDVEAYAFDAQWSEHCSYKSSRHHLKNLPTTGPTVVMGPGQDAGIVHLGEWQGERYGVVVAHESHNHPSQVVPYEGAATGVGGIVRDVLCMGAQVVAIADPLRFGRIEDPDSHQRYVATSVVDGIAGYANAIGVPNIAGDAYFDEQFNSNCLVNVVALGILKESEIIQSAAPPGSDGWDIVLVGKATDASGFGGAAFSSLSLDAHDADANKGAVQVPDPFLKNVIMRASYRVFEYLRESKITAGFKDLGAGGIMGCTAEICASGGYGAMIDLDDVSTSQENLPPAVIAIGETQERLTWIVPPEATAEVLRIYNDEFSLPEIARGACAAVIGCVSKTKRYVMRTGSEIVMDVDIDFLTGTIRDELSFSELGSNDGMDANAEERLSADHPTEVLRRILSHRDVCSRAPLYKQYDGVVRGCTVLERGLADAGVLAPVRGVPLGMAVSVAGNPRYGKIDPRRAAEHAVLEAMCKVVAVGATPIGLTDCLNFGNPKKVDQYSELVAAIDGLARAARALSVPFVSGNVSLYNEAAGGNAIPASPIVACIGALADLSKVITPAFKGAGYALYYIETGATGSNGGSVLAEVLAVHLPRLPRIDFELAALQLSALRVAMDAGLIRACKAIGNGGAVTAIAQMAFAAGKNGKRFGARVERSRKFSTLDEDGGFIVEVSSREDFEAFLPALSAHHIGAVTNDAMLIVNDQRFNIDDLHKTWSAPLTEVYG